MTDLDKAVERLNVEQVVWTTEEVRQIIDACYRALSAQSAELAKAREALGSIARNTCCGTCREAALVARQALGETND